MKQSDLILSKIAERFPGLVDDSEDVNGGDLVNFFGQFQEELAKIAERGAQTGRRKALPKGRYVVTGEATYIDVHLVTDPHVAANKFFKRRKVLPKTVESPGAEVLFVEGKCALSGAIILSGDDYVYLRDEEEIDGVVLPNLVKALRSALGKNDELEVFIEREAIEKDPADLQIGDKQYGSVEEMVRDTTDYQEWAKNMLDDMVARRDREARIRTTFGETRGFAIIESLAQATNEKEEAQVFWDHMREEERQKVLADHHYSLPHDPNYPPFFNTDDRPFTRLGEEFAEQFTQALKACDWIQ